MKNNAIGCILKLERLQQGYQQKEICFEICVPSYLSKIENGLVNTDEEILKSLFSRLHINYIYDETTLKQIKTKIDLYLHDLTYGKDTQSAYLDIKESKQQLKYSTYALDYYIIEALEGHISPYLHELEQQMNELQKSYYHIALSKYSKLSNAEEKLEHAHRIIYTSFSLNVLCNFYMTQNDFSKILTAEHEIIILGIQEGNTIQLAEYYYLKGVVYGTVNGTDFMLKSFNQALHFIENIDSIKLKNAIHYNIGSCYLTDKQYALALLHLTQANQDYSTLRMLSLCHFRKNNKEEGMKCLKQYKLLLNELDTIPLVEQYKYEEVCYESKDNFIEDDDFLNVLEKLIYELEKQCHFGHLFFYKDVIVKTYEKHRKYKKALEFNNKISSHLEKYII